MPILLDEEGCGQYYQFYQQDAQRIDHVVLEELSFFRQKLETVVERMLRVSAEKNAAILDAGCGDGVLLKMLKEAGFTNVWGADISPNRARRACTLNGGRVVVTDLEKTGLGPGSFKVIIASEILEHVPDVQIFLSNCRAMLCPGGSLIITTPSAIRWKDWPRRLWSGKKLKDFSKDPGHLRFLDRSELFKMCRAAGFEKTWSSSASILPERIWEYLERDIPGAYRTCDRFLRSVPVVNQGGSFIIAQFAKK
ncbi:methyltransferase domain-containing protein [candidate division TA06 bacterium]|nr:methyltransferase domain-containing protein [candidate division TA06 bacterium]